MKKNVLFSIPMVVIAVLLFMLKATGIGVHIGVSVAGLLVLVLYTIKTKKEWKIPALEILERVFYAAALITGVVIMNVHGIVALKIIHKISAALFTALMLACEIHKMVKK